MTQTPHDAVPAARVDDLITTRSKGEILVYDQLTHHIHHLNPVVSDIWTLCDGTRTFAHLVAESGVEPETVRFALRQLEDAKLLNGTLQDGLRGTQSRRTFMKKAVIAGAAVPAIASISAPAASAAQSGDVILCNDDSCCTGPCKNEHGETIDSTRSSPRGTYTCIRNPKKC